MKTLSEDLIRRFLKESSINNSAFIDDAPPTFYKSFGEYRDESKKWLDSLYAELGWQIVDYMISDGAEDPGFDYKLRYRALGSPTFGDAGTKRGAKESVTLWKKRKQKELSQLGWEVVAWLGEKEAYKSVIGTILAPGANQKREVSENKVQMFSKEWWLESLKTEDDIVKNKTSGNTYVVQKHNPNTQDIVKKDASPEDIAKVDDKDDVSTKKRMDRIKSFGKDPHGNLYLGDEEVGYEPKVHKAQYVTETDDSMVIGTPHMSNDDPKAGEFVRKQVVPMVQDFIKKHGAENVVFLAEGGQGDGHNYHEGTEQELVGKMVEKAGGSDDTWDGK